MLDLLLAAGDKREEHYGREARGCDSPLWCEADYRCICPIIDIKFLLMFTSIR